MGKELDSKDYFENIVNLIETARKNALKKVNEELILLYWNVGKYLCEQIKEANWGDSFIDEVAKYISENKPEIK
jgi:hypothetical protein